MAEKKDHNEELKEAVAAAVETALKETLPLVGVAAAQAMPKPAAKLTADERAARNQKCSTCRQFTLACKGKHRMAVVWPTNEAVEDMFPGLGVNGVIYNSTGPGIKIAIPEGWPMEHELAQWTAREVINLKGRRRERIPGAENARGQGTPDGWFRA